jgi:hypothetical protein
MDHPDAEAAAERVHRLRHLQPSTQPLPSRSAITGADIDGRSDSKARACGSTASTIDGFDYDGGPHDGISRRWV